MFIKKKNWKEEDKTIVVFLKKVYHYALSFATSLIFFLTFSLFERFSEFFL